jgi:hypothetical protein
VSRELGRCLGLRNLVYSRTKHGVADLRRNLLGSFSSNGTLLLAQLAELDTRILWRIHYFVGDTCAVEGATLKVECLKYLTSGCCRSEEMVWIFVLFNFIVAAFAVG